MQRMESKVVMNNAQHAAIKLAAEKSGMAISTFLRWCALREADRLGSPVKGSDQ
jgi:hypothetical protein